MHDYAIRCKQARPGCSRTASRSSLRSTTAPTGQDGFRPVVEFLIASSWLAFRAEHAAFVSPSGAPPARAGANDRTAGLDRLLDTSVPRLEPLYGFRSLHAFKPKFEPRYAPMHLAYRDEADLPRIGIALPRANLPDTPLREVVRLGRGGGH